MKNNTISVSVLILTCLIFAQALYGNDSDRENLKPSQKELPYFKHKIKSFQKADKDGDKAISFEEFSKMKRIEKFDETRQKKIFDYLDQNKDGVLHFRELQSKECQLENSLIKDFSKYDTDQNKGLDIKEIRIAARGLDKENPKRTYDRFFYKTDLNKDKLLQKFELRRRHFPKKIDFRLYDKDQSGGLDFQEYFMLPWMNKCPLEKRAKIFGRVDMDKSGEVSQEEIKNLMHNRSRKHRL